MLALKDGQANQREKKKISEAALKSYTSAFSLHKVPNESKGLGDFSIKRRGRLFKTRPRTPGVFTNPAFIRDPAFIY